MGGPACQSGTQLGGRLRKLQTVKAAFSLFKLFASLHLAIFLLTVLALVFAAGTFIESLHGTEAAKLLVYRTPWMSTLLILLALNLAAAAIDRLPWKKKHVGFVTTHAGIILILAGSLVTRAFGLEGQMALAEGETSGRIILDQPLLQVFSAETGPLALFEIPVRPFAWTGKEELSMSGVGPGPSPRVQLLNYFPKASREEKIEEAAEGPAALQVALQSSFLKVNHSLLLDDPERGRILLGPAELRFTREPLGTPAPPPTAPEGFLEFQFEHSKIEIPVPKEAPQTLSLKGTPYRVTVVRILRDAVVEGRELKDRSADWNNPACELFLEGKGIQEKHTVFSKFHDFPTLHGMKPSQSGARIFYHRPEDAGPAVKNELRFVWQEAGLPRYQIRKGETLSEGLLELGKEYETGWMDFKFRAENYFPHAKISPTFHAEPVSSKADNHVSAVRIELENGGEQKILWLGQGDEEAVTLGGNPFRVLFGFRMHPVGFRIQLRDFRIEKYPGTNQPASFESEATLKDDTTGVVRDVTIRMNQPLKHRGFKVFQSGYQQEPGSPEVSIFTVAKDPGIPLKYLGAVVLIGGILTMFYSRRFSSREDRVLQEGGVAR